MIDTLLATSTTAVESEFVRPAIDWHAVAPELVLLGWGALVTVVDLIWLERARRFMPSLAGFGFLAALLPVITLWASDDSVRTMFDGAYVVDQYSLVLKALFLVTGYIVVLISTNYMADGDYYDSEYYQLIAASVLGMLVMTSARDLITIFVAIELVSIPAYLMAAWRKRDLKSNEAGLKYMLMGVFASGILLYGMSLLYGVTGETKLTGIAEQLSSDNRPLLTLAVIFTIIGFGFKVSAVPFHTWAPDTYEGAPTPLTAFLAVASKAAGFVALLSVVLVALPKQSDVVEPLLWILAAVTMTVGNLLAMRQTNIIRMLAYSGVAQAGYMLAPLAVYSINTFDFPGMCKGDDDVGCAIIASHPYTWFGISGSVASSIVSYLLIYAATNLGAFAVVIAVARKTRSGEIVSYGGLFKYAPGLTVLMTVFLISFAGVPPVGAWLGKLQLFLTVLESQTAAGVALAVIMAVNSVLAAYYYFFIAKQMWFMPVANEDSAPVVIPAPLKLALVLTAALTLAGGLGAFTGVANL